MGIWPLFAVSKLLIDTNRYPVSLFECAWVLAVMILPERLYNKNNSFLWQLSLRYVSITNHKYFRSEDYRKYWRKKQHVNIVSVLFGAFLGSLASCMDRGLWEYPYWVLEGAVLSSLTANLVSFYLY